MLETPLSLFRRWSKPLLITLIVIDAALGVALRFMTTSKLWLDEAQGVNIASFPVSQIPHELRIDGAPPLYYVLLHFWMGVVGRTDFDVRAMSGVFAVGALVVGFFAARAWFDRGLAALFVAVFAVLPYGVYFGTETRMYALIMFESACLLLVLKWHLDRATWPNTVGVALIGAAMLYTHYWSIYLMGVIGIFSLWRWWRDKEQRHTSWRLVAAVTTSFVLFSPWLPTFNEQRLHTGTPWAPAPTLYQLFTWFDGFTVNQSAQHVTPSLHTQLTIMLFVGLLLFGIFGLMMSERSPLMQLDPRGEQWTRRISFIVLATMAAGLLASHISKSAYVPRYAAVIGVPISFLVAKGVRNFNTMLRILIVLGLFSATALWTDKWGVGVQRTQAGQVAAALSNVNSGAVVYVCPDQLGPSLVRYANPTLRYLGYPRFEYPNIVNWYDYNAAYKERTPKQNAAIQASSISANQRVFVVRAPNYGIKLTCLFFENNLAHDLGRHTQQVVKINLGRFYQSMELDELVK